MGHVLPDLSGDYHTSGDNNAVVASLCGIFDVAELHNDFRCQADALLGDDWVHPEDTAVASVTTAPAEDANIISSPEADGMYHLGASLSCCPKPGQTWDTKDDFMLAMRRFGMQAGFIAKQLSGSEKKGFVEVGCDLSRTARTSASHHDSSNQDIDKQRKTSSHRQAIIY